MKGQCGILLKNQLLRAFGINETLHSHDPKRKRNYILMLFVYVFVGAVIAFYMGGVAFVLCATGNARAVPACIAAVTSLVIFVFTVFKAGAVLFCARDYELLIPLPISPGTIVMSRFLAMYGGELGMGALTMVPACVVYAVLVRPGAAFYIASVVGIVLIPLLPMAVASAIGALITGVSSRMKHKNATVIVLSMILTVAFLVVTMSFSFSAEELTMQDMAVMLNMATNQMSRLYPLAGLYTAGVADGNMLALLGFAGISLAVFLLFFVLVQRNYTAINSALYSHAAAQNYKLGELKQTSVLRTLYGKELKRYLSTPIYVMNTGIGYVLMVAAAIAFSFIGLDQIEELIQMEGVAGKALPFILSAMGLLGTTTAVSVSIEGKQWWLPKSLPIEPKTLFQSKMLVNLTFAVPAVLLSGLLLTVTGANGSSNPIWLFLIPLCYVLFGSAAGITVNLKLPQFNWDNEVKVVKQSGSMFLFIIIWFISAFLPAILVFLAGEAAGVVQAAVCVILAAAGAGCYVFNNRCDLRKIV